MRVRPWLLGIPLLWLGCAHAPSVSGEQVAQLPPSAREQIGIARQKLDYADQNVAAARVALDEMRRFDDLTTHELDSARAELDAARTDQASRRVAAVRAKQDYADRLVDARRAELSLRRSERHLAAADFEAVKLAQLEANGRAGKLSRSDFENARTRAVTEVAHRREKVAQLNGDAEQLRVAWQERARDARTASRGTEITPPPPPELIDEQEPSLDTGEAPPAAGGANEGPSEGQSMPER